MTFIQHLSYADISVIVSTTKTLKFFKKKKTKTVGKKLLYFRLIFPEMYTSLPYQCCNFTSNFKQKARKNEVNEIRKMKN